MSNGDTTAYDFYRIDRPGDATDQILQRAAWKTLQHSRSAEEAQQFLDELGLTVEQAKLGRVLGQ